MGVIAGKVAMVTGGASGLGEAQVRRFVREGARVIICDVNETDGLALASETGAEFRMLDVRSETAFQGEINAALDRHGRFDILVNNAGVARTGTPETIEGADYRLMMAVIVDGTVFGCKHALPAMRKTGGGSIINIASIASMRGVPYAAGYSAAKGAVESYTRSVAAYCKASDINVRCNSIHPGGFATAMLGKTADDLMEMDANAGEGLKSGKGRRLGHPRDLAGLALFLASDDSAWINGQRFVIDNGDTIMAPSVS